MQPATTAPQDSVILNICIIPTQSVGDACVSLSQSLKSDRTLFALDGVNKFAHMTVYMARFANAEIPQVLSVMEKLHTEVSSFECQHSGYFLTQGRYLEVSYTKSKGFVQLHELLIERIKDFRINPGDPYEEGYFTPYTDEQRHNAATTGYDLAHGLYRPHISLTRYADGAVPRAFPAFAEAELSFMLQTMCAYKADDNGAVYEKLAEYRIS